MRSCWPGTTFGGTVTRSSRSVPAASTAATAGGGGEATAWAADGVLAPAAATVAGIADASTAATGPAWAEGTTSTFAEVLAAMGDSGAVGAPEAVLPSWQPGARP
eukprot:scaffold9366_cov118-Isochrysis_galbana.AAC.4